MPCYAIEGIVPVVDATSFVHPLASLIGDVIVGPGCYIGPGASLRGDLGRIVVEGDSSVQDNVSVHVSSDRDTLIRRGATLAHGAVIHGCEIGENALVGINAVVLDNVEIGAESLVAALAMVPYDLVAPPRSLLAGNPARIVRVLSPEDIGWRNDGTGVYQRLARESLLSLIKAEPLSEVERDRRRVSSGAAAIRLGKRAS